MAPSADARRSPRRRWLAVVVALLLVAVIVAVKRCECPVPVPCGNGVIDEDETCDDRNRVSGDGCSSACQLEPGWVCSTPGLPCTAAACGDGIIAYPEQCEDDDAPPASGDGCSATCRLEEGFACDTPGAACTPTVCGDGIVEGLEQCDDANDDLGDGCDVYCRREPVCTDGVCQAVCGDGVRQSAEACDDGNVRSGDGCSATCALEIGFECEDRLAIRKMMQIPIVYRDFIGAGLSSGHPDFGQFVIAAEPGIVADTLGADGKPVYAKEGLASATTHGAVHFDQWYRNTPGVNLTVRDLLYFPRTGTAFEASSPKFFPLDGKGFVVATTGPTEPTMNDEDGEPHNFHFTSELRYWFQYAGGETLTFGGDDDVWVFVNGHLALDLGGIHGPMTGVVTLDAAHATEYGLGEGGIYEVVVFHAERRIYGSSYTLTLQGFHAPRSECEVICGDGIVTPVELCDDGVNDGSPGSCTPDCLAAVAP